MAENKHTPGPWEAHPAPYGWDIWANSPPEQRIWVGPMRRLCSPHSKVHDGADIEADRASCEANARLIAAAPNLYRELRTSRCPRPCNHRPDDFEVGACLDAGECGCSAGAAIAKVEGRS